MDRFAALGHFLNHGHELAPCHDISSHEHIHLSSWTFTEGAIYQAVALGEGGLPSATSATVCDAQRAPLQSGAKPVEGWQSG
jgi:hypothetical protein